MLLKVVFPNWILGLTEGLRAKALAFDELEGYMRLMIQQRREEMLKSGAHNVDNADDEGDDKLMTRRRQTRMSGMTF